MDYEYFAEGDMVWRYRPGNETGECRGCETKEWWPSATPKDGWSALGYLPLTFAQLPEWAKS